MISSGWNAFVIMITYFPYIFTQKIARESEFSHILKYIKYIESIYCQFSHYEYHY